MLCLRFARWFSIALVVFLPILAKADPEELPPPADRKVDFATDIQPLFKKYCIECHGTEKQEGGLRLDMRTAALAGGDTGDVLSIPDSESSLLVRYIAGADENILMPPEGNPLTPDQVGLVRAWIDQGGQWPKEKGRNLRDPRRDHWAYQSLNQSSPPDLDDGWIRSPVDAYVLKRLQDAGLRPSPEASRAKLIRRLSLDLLGLPPTVEEVQAFIEDTNPNAYENLVDRLLESDHFGERWGRHWLDMARYADSDGYEKDRPRMNAWRWRDWVIEAINDDLPFDQFTIEQLAGDLLPDAGTDQKLATAFHRQTLTNTEGGTDQEQFRVEAVFDRVETTGTVWLGLTIGCARCHSHKYDAITQREYYGLFAFLNNGDESSLDVPRSRIEWAAFEKQHEHWQSELRKRESVLKEARQAAFPEALELARPLAGKPVSEPVSEMTAVSGGKDLVFEKLDDGSVRVTGPVPDKVSYQVNLNVREAAWITGFRIDVLPDDSLPGNGPGRAPNGNFVLGRIKVLQHRSVEGESDQRTLKFRGAKASFAQKDFAPERAFEAKNGWAISPQLGKAQHAVFELNTPLLLGSTDLFEVHLEQNYGGKHTLGRFRVSAVSDLPESVVAALGKTESDWTSDDRDLLTTTFARSVPAVLTAESALESWQNQAPEPPRMNVRVLSQRAAKQARKTRVLRRGDFLQPGSSVEPGVPSVLPELPAVEGRTGNRLDLARWLVSEQNPLTPRVAVNHVWKHLFGRGLVGTVNDFGVRGDQPSHPLLLDWLALEYRRLGWSRKQLIRRIALSSTYRQDSRNRSEATEIDAANLLLHRQNRFRVEGEIIRDLSLSVAGLLSDRIGGPSVFPPMPPDVAALSYANNFRWNESKGEDRYRRGMYTFFKRTAPHPNLITFDCPDSNTTCVERRNSNTPLQALTTLNNVVFLDAARGLARRMIEVPDADDRVRLETGFRLVVARSPQDLELATLNQLLVESRAWFEQNPTMPGELVGDKNATADSAAYISVARILLNLDEFLTRE